MKTRELDLRVAADEAAPRQSRVYLEELRPALQSQYDDIAIVLSELVTNSVKHAPRGGEIRVRMQVSESSIRLEVSDTGSGFSKSVDRDGGMGLDIVDKVSDRWGVERNDMFTVWVEIPRVDQPER